MTREAAGQTDGGTRQAPMDIAALRNDLGNDIFSALLQLQIAANRLTTSLELQSVNTDTIEATSESAGARNRAALFAWTGLELQEMTRAIDRLGKAGVDEELRWAHDSMATLRELRKRWKSNRYRQLRVKMGAHIKPDVLTRGADLLQEAVGEITAISMSGPNARHLYFAGADEILMVGVFGLPDEDSAWRRVLTQVRDDNLAVPLAVRNVVLDLWGVPEEAARESGDNTSRAASGKNKGGEHN